MGNMKKMKKNCATFDVKGAATEASASDRDTPTCAAFRAPQSLAPSPHIDTT